MSPNPEYVLGDGQRELQRLALQAQFWGGATLELLKRARIGPGMRVLDLGCGAGDVSLLAATLVGSSGSIVGIDRSPAAVEAARAKVEAAALANVEFHVAAIEDFAADRPFDALIGRFVLMYFSDPVATLRQLLPLVRVPGRRRLPRDGHRRGADGAAGGRGRDGTREAARYVSPGRHPC